MKNKNSELRRISSYVTTVPELRHFRPDFSCASLIFTCFNIYTKSTSEPECKILKKNTATQSAWVAAAFWENEKRKGSKPERKHSEQQLRKRKSWQRVLKENRPSWI